MFTIPVTQFETSVEDELDREYKGMVERPEYERELSEERDNDERYGD